MRKFVVDCIDNVLRLPMVYSECTFNMAMFQLEYEGAKINAVLTRKIKGLDYDYIYTFVNNKTTYFIYDERRGLLLKDDEKKYVNMYEEY